MYKRLFTLLPFAFGAGLALSSANCGPMCPAGQQSCGNSNASVAGSSGADAGSSTCGLMTALKKCMTAFCATATNPFCTCYKRGYDLNGVTCKCVDFDPELCKRAEANGSDGSDYDCAAESSRISSYCVPVR